MTKPKRKRISLALQGGGALGAYTWGALDRLLEDEHIEIAAISGSSAGAMCAVVVAEPGRAPEVHVDALRVHCRDRLASFKHPRRVEVVAELPRTPATGQVQRTLIVERIVGSN